MSKPLIIIAHPHLHTQSNIHQKLFHKLKDLDLTLHDLYALYPDFTIDVKKEQELLRSHDHIIFEFPFYWYSAPALLKEWEDRVLSYGFAYGSEGTALKDKKLTIVTSTGGPKEAYAKNGYNHFTMEELLRPFEQTASLCKMHYQKPLVLAGALNVDDTAIDTFFHSYENIL